MSKLMLIDAVHPEETRVALSTNGHVDDFDFETTGREQLRGNIYLAKVTRVEPSLQAAFVEYGGNRHGFLAFSEIHPDYYQLPQADREALLREAAEAAAEEEGFDFDDDEDDDGVVARDHDKGDAEGETDHDCSTDEEADAGEAVKSQAEASGAANGASGTNGRRRGPRNSQLKRYKIQEVIRRRQIMLVQVVKEERGNKGAALTTYLSLAGRYSVLMPNTPRGGGISRKISNASDRKRLKAVMGELDVPAGMGLIVRTAGAKRTKTEIKRDYDYLIKLWDTIRERTLTSIAPCLIHEEGGLVHRAMRDMFDKDLEEVWVQGDRAYREAKDLVKVLMPSQARKVRSWKEPTPLFVEFGVEEQLDSIFSPTVTLKSGGYLVINQTEALVAIDVNSGKSTKARNIEQTALRTNLEAAEEACRQMRLRDLAGLVVIDFIDMDESKNNRAVEKKVKDCLKADRARVQTGKISQFGLMEISRQRRRAGVLQTTSEPCDVCAGTGRRRSVYSAALQLLRAIESRVADGTLKHVRVEAPTEVALYILNNKRDTITEIEQTSGTTISISSKGELLPGDFSISVEKDPNAKPKPKRARPQLTDTRSALDVVDADDEVDDDETVETSDDEDETSAADGEDRSPDSDEDGSTRKRRRRGRRGGRRRRRSGRDDGQAAGNAAEDAVDAPQSDAPDEADTASPAPTTGTSPEDPAPASAPPAAAAVKGKPDIVPADGGAYLDGLSVTPGEVIDPSLMPEGPTEAPTEAEQAEAAQTDAATESEPAKPSRRRRSRRKPRGEAEPAPTEATQPKTDEPVAETAPSAKEPAIDSAPFPDKAPATPEPVADAPKPAAAPEPAAEPAAEPANDPTPEPAPAAAASPSPAIVESTPEIKVEGGDADTKPKKRGWWSRRLA